MKRFLHKAAKCLWRSNSTRHIEILVQSSEIRLRTVDSLAPSVLVSRGHSSMRLTCLDCFCFSADLQACSVVKKHWFSSLCCTQTPALMQCLMFPQWATMLLLWSDPGNREKSFLKLEDLNSANPGGADQWLTSACTNEREIDVNHVSNVGCKNKTLVWLIVVKLSVKLVFIQ